MTATDVPVREGCLEEGLVSVADVVGFAFDVAVVVEILSDLETSGALEGQWGDREHKFLVVAGKEIHQVEERVAAAGTVRSAVELMENALREGRVIHVGPVDFLGAEEGEAGEVAGFGLSAGEIRMGLSGEGESEEGEKMFHEISGLGLRTYSTTGEFFKIPPETDPILTEGRVQISFMTETG
jgi:hypothetical protein